MVKVSVPGKVILMGDHAVVYGKPGLIAAMNKRLTVTVEPSKTFQVVSSEPDEYIRHIVQTIVDRFNLKSTPNVQITVTSDIPAGYHLGSSAAVAVATVGALMYYLKKIWNPTAINQMAYETEKYIHKTPSGVDNTAVTFGGFLWYRKELEFLRSFWQLPMKLPKSFNHFYLIDTGRPKENTGEMVSMVKLRIQNSMTKMKKFFDENEEQTKKIAVAINDEDEAALIDGLRKGEKTLEGMGVVSRKVLSTIRSVEASGGAAKILGGGGKTAGVGYLLAYTHSPKSEWIPITLGEEGVRLESK